MAYIETGSEERIDPATVADLDRLFASSRIFGVAVHQDENHAVQATVTGDSALVLSIDHKKAKAFQPEGRINRDQALAILATYLRDGKLDPDYTWSDAGLPTVKTGGGCGVAAVLLIVATSGVAVLGSMAM